MNDTFLRGATAWSLSLAVLEVLALSPSGGTCVAAAPMVLEGGAGVAVGGSF